MVLSACTCRVHIIVNLHPRLISTNSDTNSCQCSASNFTSSLPMFKCSCAHTLACVFIIIIIIIIIIILVLLLQIRHPSLFLTLFQKFTILTHVTELFVGWIICRMDHTPTCAQINVTITWHHGRESSFGDNKYPKFVSVECSLPCTRHWTLSRAR